MEDFGGGAVMSRTLEEEPGGAEKERGAGPWRGSGAQDLGGGAGEELVQDPEMSRSWSGGSAGSGWAGRRVAEVIAGVKMVVENFGRRIIFSNDQGRDGAEGGRRIQIEDDQGERSSGGAKIRGSG